MGESFESDEGAGGQPTLGAKYAWQISGLVFRPALCTSHTRCTRADKGAVNKSNMVRRRVGVRTKLIWVASALRATYLLRIKHSIVAWDAWYFGTESRSKIEKL